MTAVERCTSAPLARTVPAAAGALATRAVVALTSQSGRSGRLVALCGSMDDHGLEGDDHARVELRSGAIV